MNRTMLIRDENLSAPCTVVMPLLHPYACWRQQCACISSWPLQLFEEQVPPVFKQATRNSWRKSGTALKQASPAGCQPCSPAVCQIRVECDKWWGRSSFRAWTKLYRQGWQPMACQAMAAGGTHMQAAAQCLAVGASRKWLHEACPQPGMLKLRHGKLWVDDLPKYIHKPHCKDVSAGGCYLCRLLTMLHTPWEPASQP